MASSNQNNSTYNVCALAEWAMANLAEDYEKQITSAILTSNLPQGRQIHIAIDDPEIKQATLMIIGRQIILTSATFVEPTPYEQMSGFGRLFGNDQLSLGQGAHGTHRNSAWNHDAKTWTAQTDRSIMGLDHPFFSKLTVASVEPKGRIATIRFRPPPMRPWRLHMIKTATASPSDKDWILHLRYCDAIARHHLLGIGHQQAEQIASASKQRSYHAPIPFTDESTGQAGLLYKHNEGLRSIIRLAPNFVWAGDGGRISDVPETLRRALKPYRKGPARALIDHPALDGYHINTIQCGKAAGSVCFTVNETKPRTFAEAWIECHGRAES